MKAMTKNFQTHQKITISLIQNPSTHLQILVIPYGVAKTAYGLFDSFDHLLSLLGWDQTVFDLNPTQFTHLVRDGARFQIG